MAIPSERRESERSEPLDALGRVGDAGERRLGAEASPGSRHAVGDRTTGSERRAGKGAARGRRGLERYAERLATHEQLTRYEGYAESTLAGDVGAFFDQSPLIGLANPLAPPISIRQTGERCAEGRVTFGAAYEGPPGCVHGGFVAAAFDEVLGFAQSLTGNPGFTGTLTVVYRQPTPLHTELRFDANVVSQERRKIFTEGRVTAGDLITAEARGIFISVDREKFLRLLEARQKLDPKT